MHHDPRVLHVNHDVGILGLGCKGVSLSQFPRPPLAVQLQAIPAIAFDFDPVRFEGRDSRNIASLDMDA